MDWERILRVELKLNENVTRIVTYEPNKNELTRDRDDFWEILNLQSKMLRAD